MEKADHIIVLMLENRSFDHLLGYLEHPKRKQFDWLKGNETCPDDNGKPVRVSKKARYSIGGPDHSHAGIMQQLGYTAGPPYKPTNKGFVKNYEAHNKGKGRDIMRCFDPRMVPVLSTLALEFAVCTRWFCSVPGETWPNREFAHSGTSRGNADIAPIHFTSSEKTIYELLDDAGKTWCIYHDDVPHSWTYTALWDTPFKRNRFQPIRRLYKDIRDDRLPHYTFVEPDYGLAVIGQGWGNSMHPEQAPSSDEFLGGERLIHAIYDELRAHPKVFEKTVFVVTFDEHGGFYDHVPPLPTKSPDDRKWKGTFNFDLLGVRVPALIISPWIARHTVDDTVYDHTSLIQTVRQHFAPEQDPLTKRDKAAAPIALDRILTNTLRPSDDLPITLPLSTAEGERLEEEIARDDKPRALTMNAMLQGSGVDQFKTAMLALSASVGARLALEANQKSITRRGLMSVSRAPGGDVAPSPAAVLHQFRASAEDEASARPAAPLALAAGAPGGRGRPKKVRKGAPKVRSMTAASRASALAAGAARGEIAALVLAVLDPLTRRHPIKETDTLEKDLGLDEEERMELSFPFAGIVRRYRQASISRDECGALKTVRNAIDLVHGKTVG